MQNDCLHPLFNAISYDWWNKSAILKSLLKDMSHSQQLSLQINSKPKDDSIVQCQKHTLARYFLQNSGIQMPNYFRLQLPKKDQVYQIRDTKKSSKTRLVSFHYLITFNLGSKENPTNSVIVREIKKHLQFFYKHESLANRTEKYTWSKCSSVCFELAKCSQPNLGQNVARKITTQNFLFHFQYFFLHELKRVPGGQQ